MSHYYQKLDRGGGFDYGLYQIPNLGSRGIRGPPVDTTAPYLAFVGAAQTFGRFATVPFPSLLGASLGTPVLNLAAGGAGPRYFLTREYLELINGAEAVVIQILSGRSASNSLFDNSESGGMTGRLRGEQSTIRADVFFSRLGQSSSRSQIEEIVDETRKDYTSQFVQLLREIIVPKILFWFSTRAPMYTENYGNIPYGIFGAFPQLVNQEMVEELAAFSDEYVECISSDGLPQSLWRNDQSIDGAVSNKGMLENRYYPSPAMHVAAADALENTCRRFLARHKVPPSHQAVETFVIVAAPRTGTNLLIGLLNDFEGCFVGNELFNDKNISNDIIPWHDISDADWPVLLALRRRDPVVFWQTLCAHSANRGFQTVGFKLLYSQGLSQEDLLEHLVADETIPIIHIKRRNLLRRLVSERQASATGRWAVSATSAARAPPKVAITINDIVRSIGTTEAHQATFDSRFAEHPVLRLIYEDLARRPVRTAERVAEFLGLRAARNPPTVKYRKTGHEKLLDTMADFKSLRAKMRRWGSFFDE